MERRRGKDVFLNNVFVIAQCDDDEGCLFSFSSFAFNWLIWLSELGGRLSEEEEGKRLFPPEQNCVHLNAFVISMFVC